MQLDNAGAEIAVVGRCSFGTGIGSMTYAACEMLARNFPVCILPTEAELRAQPFVILPNGRKIPVCKEPERIKVSYFCDVLWNGTGDFNYALTPANSLKYAWLVYDSDQLPAKWVQLLNEHFDLVVATSPHLIDVAAASGVETPVACLPIPLNLEPLLAAPVCVRNEKRVRFGSVAAFHARKGTLTLVQAFLNLFADHPDIELILHSNLSFGDVYDQVTQLAGQASNIHITNGNLSEDEKNRLIRSFDVFVNCSRGEGYSIGAREALAYGKALVLSDVGGHKDLAGVPGVIMMPAELIVPARYPEIDNATFGRQYAVRTTAVETALHDAATYALSQEYERTVYARRRAACSFTFSALSTHFAALLNPELPRFRQRPMPPDVHLPPAFKEKVVAHLGPRADRLSAVRHQVCAAYDAGFFSIFNSFMSHLVWQQQEDRCHAVYPDWDVDRLIERLGHNHVTSFCYGQPGDGNLWLHFFEPLFGASRAQMDDVAFLYRHASEPEFRHNEVREPLMTFVHAYRLYKTQEFAAWRRQYHRVFQQHVKLRASLQAEVDAFSQLHLARPFMIAAHVRHPSHIIEQPNAIIAHDDSYISAIYDAVRTRGIDVDGPDWGVFLATDQEKVVRRFRTEFGERLSCYDDVRRTGADEDAAFNALSSEERCREGHQLQHLVAAERSRWSARMAWEVIRDAYAMAQCHMLLHVVSNVSTAVAYMNPEMELVFCSPH